MGPDPDLRVLSLPVLVKPAATGQLRGPVGEVAVVQEQPPPGGVRVLEHRAQGGLA